LYCAVFRHVAILRMYNHLVISCLNILGFIIIF
jgi:hypothetical protein